VAMTVTAIAGDVVLQIGSKLNSIARVVVILTVAQTILMRSLMAVVSCSARQSSISLEYWMSRQAYSIRVWFSTSSMIAK